ncbi:MAG: hypothetical protein LUH04_10805 [Clostridium sp.]|nr:hypothetical protein [Clostridium sp.]
MKITRDNLDEVMFENQDARLLIEDIVASTSANLYYYHDREITVRMALELWYKAQAADCTQAECAGEESQWFCLPERMDTKVRQRLESAVYGLRRRLETVWPGPVGLLQK